MLGLLLLAACAWITEVEHAELLAGWRSPPVQDSGSPTGDTAVATLPHVPRGR